MKVYNQDKTEILESYDLELGYLVPDKIVIAEHDATEEVKEISRYVTVQVYPNGGKDTQRVIDVPYQPAREACTEYEDIQVYIPYAEEDLAKMHAKKRIVELKGLLAVTDYQAIKYAEGWITEKEYAPIKAQRQAYRDEINELEKTAGTEK